MTAPPLKPRPLSPHLGIYRWQISSVLSIFHRATGVALSIGLVLFVAWLLYLAAGKEGYNIFINNIESILGQLAMVVLCAFLAYGILCFAFHSIWKRPPSSDLIKCIVQVLLLVIGFAVAIAARHFFADAFPASFDTTSDIAGEIVLIGITWSFFYHCCAGIRHLFWDSGKFLSLRGMHVTGWIVIAASILPTLYIWLKIWGVLR